LDDAPVAGNFETWGEALRPVDCRVWKILSVDDETLSGQPGKPAEITFLSDTADPWADKDDDEEEDEAGEKLSENERHIHHMREMSTRMLLSYGGAKGTELSGAYLPEVETGDTLLMLAMRAQDKELVRMILRELKPDMNMRNLKGSTAFNIAEVHTLSLLIAH
jgi:hypothetical protein